MVVYKYLGLPGTTKLWCLIEGKWFLPI